MGNSMDEIKRMICQEIDEIAEKGEMSSGDLDAINKLVITKEKLLRIEELEEDLGYSEDGDWRAEGSYGRGGSYRGSYRGNSNRSYARGSSRRRGYSSRDRVMDMMDNGDFSYSQRQSLDRMMNEY